MGKDIANDFVNRVKDIPEVAECYNISGDFDYLLKIYAPDMQYYNNFLINTLGTIDSLGSVEKCVSCNRNLIVMTMREFLYDTKPLPEEPDDLVVINPTRINEPDGAILVYRKEGVLLFDGKQIPIDKIVEGYVSNSNNNPYLPVAYHILLAMDDKNIVHIPAGQDFEWAQEALKQLQAAIAPQE